MSVIPKSVTTVSLLSDNVTQTQSFQVLYTPVHNSLFIVLTVYLAPRRFTH